MSGLVGLGACWPSPSWWYHAMRHGAFLTARCTIACQTCLRLVEGNISPTMICHMLTLPSCSQTDIMPAIVNINQVSRTNCKLCIMNDWPQMSGLHATLPCLQAGAKTLSHQLLRCGQRAVSNVAACSDAHQNPSTSKGQLQVHCAGGTTDRASNLDVTTCPLSHEARLTKH